MNDANFLCIMFNFGVPLEDIFPPKSIHPKLQSLFVEAYSGLKLSRLCLNDVLRQSSLSDGLNMKEAVVKGKLSNTDEATPATYFWLLRHFFGLLPLPLFPSFTDGQFYNWENLSARCKLNCLRTNWELETEISWWIHKLPKANILLLYTLIDFLRKISVKRNSLDWKNVKTASAYFSSSLFVRPYRPGVVSKGEGLYSHLLRYLIVKWSRIRRSNRESYIDHLSLLHSVDKETESRTFEDSGCQTSSWLLCNSSPTQDILSQECDESQGCVECDFNSQKMSLLNESRQSQNKVDDHYEIINEDSEKVGNVTSSQTTIYQKSDTKLTTPKELFRRKMIKAHRSLGSVISKVKQEMFKRSGANLEEYKYNLLEKPVKKTESLHANRCVKNSPYIKYKKLMTL